ncbi:EcsC family protein [Aeromicrobium duanguangcaii]|uniref:EcsC family protein n=1 Tax=Aeromicrobium duanguangcaii TaxID=2968086 RepID=A0ABY5KEZ8_9ACTN|nr:EcsC family protein [Aeromicrobium duanguangcaii]MCD9154325.1 EcsC family protein [Aeromicrobium duanguangcaii]MCL3838071.1 EcsC family protein [Aeromicrobium duanguangcaii]UUI68608.1 EcsC family protein [Aeromicrobium duanguangcaii]
MGMMKDRIAKEAGTRVVPNVASGYVRAVLDMAIDGVGPLRPVIETAGGKLAAHGGDVEKTVAALVRSHTSLAGLQGFVTNLGGIAFAAATVPANVVGVTIVQCHLVASIAHLRGYDLEDPRVRNAVLAVMLGEDTVTEMVKKKRLPSSPMALATSPAHDPLLDDRIAKEVTGELVGRTIGRRALMLAGKRIPLLGGAVGAGADGFGTWQVGRYAQSELKDRRLRR